ncbi:DUF397 domain-containing protein [Streptomyces sp. SID4934]|uniref:DUF397 domain-containing protein n=1 Tax=unclassified Streptomyces TaxID=2593676 RepID=UPI000249472E|nr:DUF397 domain-containing protein [Streptomyces sp. ScaeMP-6W]MYQ73988.1 DUF397 domain-containing protein [Streptomyces sp. SID4934]SCE34574.1 protein of unknown function [Streptomyces sp. ScaeMP-6W]
MVRHELPVEAWKKSTYSGDTHGQCIEIQAMPEGSVAVGDSKDRSRGAFVFPAAAWANFVTEAKNAPLT